MLEIARAVAEVTEAIGLRQTNPTFYDSGGNAYTALGDNLKAKQDHKKVEELRAKMGAAATSTSQVMSQRHKPIAD